VKQNKYVVRTEFDESQCGGGTWFTQTNVRGEIRDLTRFCTVQDVFLSKQGVKLQPVRWYNQTALEIFIG